MKTLIALSLLVMGYLFFTNELHAQSYHYPEYDMEGDTIWHSFPPPMGIYAPNQIILKFLNGTLNYDSLCYDCGSITHDGRRRTFGDAGTDFDDCKPALMAQQFSLDIIKDTIVRSVLARNGVSYLRRMTAANPCVDTLSLSRFGDTLRMDDFNWMVAVFDNDTSVISTLVQLFNAYDGTLRVAEPDYYLQPAGPPFNPMDPQYMEGNQISLAMIGMSSAWGIDLGDTSIKVAVVDQGVDYWRCDLGHDSIPKNKKVIGGFDYRKDSVNTVYEGSIHGTQVASIIAALTNNSTCGAVSGMANGMAGIAGGSNGIDGTPDSGTGVKLVAYNVVEQPGAWASSAVASAILEASANSINGSFGYGVDVINMSGGYDSNTPNYSIAVRNAMSESWKNAVTFVAAENDIPTATDSTYPYDQEPASEVVCVGNSGKYKNRKWADSWGFHTDLIAPGGGDTDAIALALQFDGNDGPTAPSSDADTFGYFGGTSGAAPHVSGVTALLRGWLDKNGIKFSREDIEGMLDASALDLISPTHIDPDGTHYLPGFDDRTGWGFLQADQLFNMLDPVGTFGYELGHVEIPHDSLHIPVWPDTISYDSVVIFSSTPDTNNVPLDTVYDVKIREITGTASYASLGFNRADSVYVWGNSGFGLSDTVHRGMANLLPNWSENWCGVTSGLFGNQGAVARSGDTIYTNRGVPGIHHSYSTEVTCHTFQYQLFHHGSLIPVRSLPPDSELGLGYTAFGATIFTSIVHSDENVFSLSLWPTLASTVVHVAVDNGAGESNLKVFDEMGREIFSESIMPGTNLFDVPVSNLPSGIYLGQVANEKGLENVKFIVQH